MHFVLLELIKYGSRLAVQSIPIKKYNKPIYNNMMYHTTNKT